MLQAHQHVVPSELARETPAVGSDEQAPSSTERCQPAPTTPPQHLDAAVSKPAVPAVATADRLADTMLYIHRGQANQKGMVVSFQTLRKSRMLPQVSTFET